MLSPATQLEATPRNYDYCPNQHPSLFVSQALSLKRRIDTDGQFLGPACYAPGEVALRRNRAQLGSILGHETAMQHCVVFMLHETASARFPSIPVARSYESGWRGTRGTGEDAERDQDGTQQESFAGASDSMNDPRVDARRDLRARCEALFREHHKVLVRTLYRRLRCWEDAKEVAQEAFLRVFRLEAPPSIALLHAYVFKVALNLAHDRHVQHQRHQQREALVYAEVYAEREQENLTPERQYLDEESAVILQRSVATLPQKTRVGFTLVELEGLSVEEAAQIMRVSKTAVYQLIYRAYGRMARNCVEGGPWHRHAPDFPGHVRSSDLPQ